MAYTPELYYEYSCTLRRIAWSLKLPMTKAMPAVIDHYCKTIDTQKVCDRCRDKTKCDECSFNHS